jgi:hypothetical protein
MLASTRRVRPLEYSILHNPRAAGPVIGQLGGKEFTEYVYDEFNRLFVYSGAAPRRLNGEFDDDALKTGEFIVLPGLIYKYSGKARRKAA